MWHGQTGLPVGASDATDVAKGVYFTLLNPTNVRKTFTLLVDRRIGPAGGRARARLLLQNRTASFQRVAGESGVRLVLPPGGVELLQIGG